MFQRVFRCSALMLTVAVSTTLSLAQTAAKPVTPEDVISMTQVGLSDQIIIAKIKAHNQPMDLTTDQLVTLKKGKVSDGVISALIDPSAAAAPTSTVVVGNPLLASGNSSGATTGLSGDPNDPMSPHESGIYVYTKDHDGKPKMVELERTAYQGARRAACLLPR